jgi:pilus assembly protein Flp/PilA
MSKIINFARQFWADEEGATAIEYGLLAALIAVVIIAGVASIGTNLETTFLKIADCMKQPKGALCT